MVGEERGRYITRGVGVRSMHADKELPVFFVKVHSFRNFLLSLWSWTKKEDAKISSFNERWNTKPASFPPSHLPSLFSSRRSSTRQVEYHARKSNIVLGVEKIKFQPKKNDPRL